LKSQYNRPVKPSHWKSTLVLIIFVLLVGVFILAFLGVEPFYGIKTWVKEWTENLQMKAQEVIPVTGQTVPAVQTPPESIAKNIGTQQTVGGWTYTLNGITWEQGNVVKLNVTVRNDGKERYPFGFSYQVDDKSFVNIYKLCAVDSNRHVFWDTINASDNGTGFYNRYFSPGEAETGSLKYIVNAESEKVYLCISVGGNPGTKLFYLGNPR